MLRPVYALGFFCGEPESRLYSPERPKRNDDRRREVYVLMAVGHIEEQDRQCWDK